MKENTYLRGLKSGLAIGLGYLSVSFGFGITAVGKGLLGFEAILISMTNLTSAGQLAGITVIAACGSVFELMLTQLIINLRYCLMGLALTQKLDNSFTTLHRLIISFGITDEVFAVASAEKGSLNRRFMYGLITLPYIGWALGTSLGAFAGQILPASVCSALGIAIYSMFIAIIIPDTKTDKGVLLAVILSTALSCAFYFIPFLSHIPQGFAIIICAVVVSAILAYFFPKKFEEEEE